MNISFSFGIDEEKEKKRIEESYRKAFLNSAHNYVDRLFRDGRFDGNKGPGYQIVESFIEDELLKEKSEKIARAYIDNNWERILHEAMEKALTHKANKIAFAKVKEQNETSQ